MHQNDTEELLSWFLERIADLIEPIEEISEMSAQKGTLFEQLEYFYNAAYKQRELIIRIQLKSKNENLMPEEMKSIKNDADNLYSTFLENITLLRNQVNS